MGAIAVCEQIDVLSRPPGECDRKRWQQLGEAASGARVACIPRFFAGRCLCCRCCRWDVSRRRGCTAAAVGLLMGTQQAPAPAEQLLLLLLLLLRGAQQQHEA